jgi:hypothetical protein
MRGAARFAAVRELVTQSRRMAHAGRVRPYLARLDARLDETAFPGISRHAFVLELRDNGIAFGLKLPPETVSDIVAVAESQPCYADRNPRHGFYLQDRAAAEAALGKPILLAQYFNAAESPAIRRLMDDPLLQAIACDYLQSMPTFVGANLWWTFPVKALESDRAEHAHLFHRDVDDFRFFKFFFYLTDVAPGEGAHVCVVASHRRPPISRTGDRWNIRRYSDDEIAAQFAPDKILEICGPAGTGFAENTLCVHKGRTPTTRPRLLLQLQYALFDYGAMHDRRRADELTLIT